MPLASAEDPELVIERPHPMCRLGTLLLPAIHSTAGRAAKLPGFNVTYLPNQDTFSTR